VNLVDSTAAAARRLIPPRWRQHRLASGFIVSGN
jgi:hypothetical protein